jgi:CubicO group peptidase (beta-lactamase class C family)
MKTPTLITLAVSTLIAHAQPAKYQNAIPKLESTIQEEMAEWNIAGVSVALVNDQEIVYSKGFGEAKQDSIFRAGSISKLFNALAVMQQVDAGNLDLDAPIPSARLPINPFSDNPSVTLRHILSHRSGLQREAPIGSYLV